MIKTAEHAYPLHCARMHLMMVVCPAESQKADQHREVREQEGAAVRGGVSERAGMDTAQLLTACVSREAPIRTQAEAALQDGLKQPACILQLLQYIQNSSAEQVGCRSLRHNLCLFMAHVAMEDSQISRLCVCSA